MLDGCSCFVLFIPSSSFWGDLFGPSPSTCNSGARLLAKLQRQQRWSTGIGSYWLVGWLEDIMDRMIVVGDVW